MKKNILTLLFAFTLIASASWELDFDDDFASASTSTPDVLDGLIARWELSSNTDNSFLPNDSTANVTITTAQGKSCARFNGDGYINGYVNSTFETNVTICAWVLRDTDSKGFFFKSDGYPNGVGYGVGTGTVESNGDKLICLYEAIAWKNSGVAISEEWTFTAMEIDANGHLNMFKNGDLIYSNTDHTPNASVTNNGVCVGALWRKGVYNINYFNGYLKDVRVYNRNLSTNELQTIYNKFK